MPKWPFKEPARDPATEEALRRIEEARKSGATLLDLSSLKLSTLPEAIGRLPQLQELNLSSNQLSTLPGAIGRLSQLQMLDLYGIFLCLRYRWDKARRSSRRPFQNPASSYPIRAKD